MKLLAAILSTFVMFGVLTAAPASACHWKKGYHAGKHYKSYKHKHFRHYRHHKRCKHC